MDIRNMSDSAVLLDLKFYKEGMIISAKMKINKVDIWMIIILESYMMMKKLKLNFVKVCIVNLKNSPVLFIKI
jgi:hypothetical protein